MKSREKRPETGRRKEESIAHEEMLGELKKIKEEREPPHNTLNEIRRFLHTS